MLSHFGAVHWSTCVRMVRIARSTTLGRCATTLKCSLAHFTASRDGPTVTYEQILMKQEYIRDMALS